MAKKSKKDEKFNYNASVNALKAEGPAGLYLIWGAGGLPCRQIF